MAESKEKGYLINFLKLMYGADKWTVKEKLYGIKLRDA